MVSDSPSLFTLAVQPKQDNTLLTMQFNTPFLDTSEIPMTYSILSDNLPSILRCKCFNDEDLPFHEEVQQTEIGHLFEHILLEYLTAEKKRSFNGNTRWNWYEDTRGTFHITVDWKENDPEVLNQAIRKSVELLSLILESKLMQNSK